MHPFKPVVMEITFANLRRTPQLFHPVHAPASVPLYIGLLYLPICFIVLPDVAC